MMSLVKHHRSLARQGTGALDQLFGTLPAARIDGLRPHMRGHLVAVAGLDWVPGGVRALVFERGLWRGNNFDGEFGSNAWVVGSRIEFARFLVREGEAVDGIGKVLRMDYDVAANPRVLRGLVGELRELGGGAVLGRMWVAGRRLGYVVLEA